MLARLFMIILFGLCLNIHESKAEPAAVQTAWLDEMETFPAWYAHKNKWDLEEGIVIKMNSYSAGRVLVDSHASQKWKIGSCGLIPALNGIIEKDLEIIALGADETEANVIFGRKNGKILPKPVNQAEYSAVKGDAESVIGSLILCPYGSNSHRLLLKWIEILGLNESLVSIQDMSPEKAVSSFSKGFGDAVSFWLPSASSFYADDSLIKLADARDCNISFYTVLLADKKFAENNPEQVQAVVNAYLKAVEAINAMPEEEKINLYKEFRWEWGNTVISDEIARLELETHRLFGRSEQKQLVAESGTAALYKVIEETLPFIESYFALDRRDKEFLEGYTYVNNMFLENN